MIKIEIAKTVIDVDNIVYPNRILPDTTLWMTLFHFIDIDKAVEGYKLLT